MAVIRANEWSHTSFVRQSDNAGLMKNALHKHAHKFIDRDPINIQLLS
jgi:hypothetical protein